MLRKIDVTILAFGSQPKQGAWKGEGRKCGWMWGNEPTHSLGVGVLKDFQIFREWFKRSKIIGLKSFLYH